MTVLEVTLFCCRQTTSRLGFNQAGVGISDSKYSHRLFTKVTSLRSSSTGVKFHFLYNSNVKFQAGTFTDYDKILYTSNIALRRDEFMLIEFLTSIFSD